jgi:hypothetical protein
MGAITRAAANNITTGGIILPAGITDSSVASITSVDQVPGGGGLNLISTATASGSASIEFTSGIDSTYDIYLFEMVNLAVDTDDRNITLNFSTDGGSNYNVTKTTTSFRAIHTEDDVSASLDYRANADLAQSTANQTIGEAQEGEADSNLGGRIYLFNPSSTTYVKHFMYTLSQTGNVNELSNGYFAGYANTTSAINGVKFFGNSTTITGTIRMYGVKSS